MLHLNLLLSRLKSPSFLSLSSHVRYCSPLTSLWPFAVLPPVCPCFSWTGEPRTGLITLDMASAMLNRGEYAQCYVTMFWTEQWT